jgi:hypothetical protein
MFPEYVTAPGAAATAYAKAAQKIQATIAAKSTKIGRWLWHKGFIIFSFE